VLYFEPLYPDYHRIIYLLTYHTLKHAHTKVTITSIRVDLCAFNYWIRNINVMFIIISLMIRQSSLFQISIIVMARWHIKLFTERLWKYTFYMHFSLDHIEYRSMKIVTHDQTNTKLSHFFFYCSHVRQSLLSWGYPICREMGTIFNDSLYDRVHLFSYSLHCHWILAQPHRCKWWSQFWHVKDKAVLRKIISSWTVTVIKGFILAWKIMAINTFGNKEFP